MGYGSLKTRFPSRMRGIPLQSQLRDDAEAEARRAQGVEEERERVEEAVEEEDRRSPMLEELQVGTFQSLRKNVSDLFQPHTIRTTRLSRLAAATVRSSSRNHTSREWSSKFI